MNQFKLKYGDWALITGASAGIGEEFANKLASLGFNLVLAARRKDRLSKLKDELEKNYNVEVVAAPLDLLSENYLKELTQIIGDRHISLLVNNAGFGYRGEFLDGSAYNDEKMIKLNCIVPTVLTHHFVKPMIEKRKGGIIFLASLVAFQATPTTTTYSATKVFNAFLAEGLWYELKKYNIDVLSLNPGGTITEFQQVANSTAGPMPRTAKQVVETALKALGKKPSVVDGLYNKFLAVSTRFISRRLTVSLAGKISELFYKKH
ncbi:MAG: short-chain dehydrogenase/reductase SDR [Ignavibacteria bacterium]|nr:MAG: short-chain dehydrogenase/reductase SDR [Ignavibacteria bacterium]KAF0160353.1 MAG: short-chain dehydrogenase/reductase SDR [Ignavibacteria bacterium]